MIEIPLTAEPDQTFSLSLNGQQYTFTVRYNSRYGIWVMDISQGGTLILAGIGLLAGVDIYQQFPELPIKNAYVVDLENHHLDASADNLGSRVKLFILTEEELGGTPI